MKIWIVYTTCLNYKYVLFWYENNQKKKIEIIYVIANRW